MNHGLDDLTDLLDDWGDAAAAVTPSLTDVRRRAQRRQLGTRAGTAAAVAVAGGLAATAVAIRGADPQRLATGGPASAGGEPSLVRRLPLGHELRVTPLEPRSTFGPFGPERRWDPPADCDPAAAVDLRFEGEADGDGEGWTRVDALLDERAPAVVRDLGWSVDASGAPGSSTTAVAVLLASGVAGDRYRLVDGRDEVLDEVTATHPLVALAAPVPGVGPDDPLPALRLVEVDRSGRVVEDQPLPEPRPADQVDRCVSPPEPTGIGPLSAADSTDPDDVAIRAAVAALSTSDEIEPALASPEIHRDGDHAWARTWESFTHLPIEERRPGPPAGGWLELRRTDGRWRVTHESRCALLDALGEPACPAGN